jgi:hypothetical protein
MIRDDDSVRSGVAPDGWRPISAFYEKVVKVKADVAAVLTGSLPELA